MVCFLLKLIHTSEISSTAKELAEIITEQVLSKYPNLEVNCAVTDSAANMIATAHELKIKHVPCYVHRLQSVIKAAIISIKPQSSSVTDETPKNNQKKIDKFFKVLDQAEYNDLDKYMFLTFLSVLAN